MPRNDQPVRVLYSFPHKIGARRICYTAWEQVNGLSRAGAEVLAFPGVVHRPMLSNVKVQATLQWGKARISYKLFGTVRACRLHDHIVARRLRKLAGKVDIVHAWALGSKETLKTATELGIPTVLERQNAHTRFVYGVVQKECERLGIELPPEHEYTYNEEVLRREEEEYKLAYKILCPSEFVVKTFLDQGFSREKLVRHIYGYDETRFYPNSGPQHDSPGLTAIFVGLCAVSKGLHFALEAWLKSPAHRNGTFLICGTFLPAYQEKLAPLLAHPSVRVLGQRSDVQELMRKSDLLVFPSMQEGFGLVCPEAMGSGCVPLVSDACTDVCQHMRNSLVHHVGDVETLTRHFTQLNEDRGMLQKLRAGALASAPGCTWTSAGVQLLDAYRSVIASFRNEKRDLAGTGSCEPELHPAGNHLR